MFIQWMRRVHGAVKRQGGEEEEKYKFPVNLDPAATSTAICLLPSNSSFHHDLLPGF